MPVTTIFWILFFIVLIIAFFVLLPTVRKGGAGVTEQPAPQNPPVTEQETPGVQTPAQNTRQDPPPVAQPVERPTTAPAVEPPQAPPAGGQGSPQVPPAGQTASQPPASPPPEKPAETRDRTIYFMQETRGGAELVLTRVNRKLPVSNSPLTDCLNALFAGPTADEKTRNIVNLISPRARLISARMEGNTAHINFNEEFQYNPDGREGLDAQIKQIVWTATEFPTVHDVQILIEGKRVDFIGEGIMIGSPLRR